MRWVEDRVAARTLNFLAFEGLSHTLNVIWKYFLCVCVWFNIYYNLFFCDNWIYTGITPNTTGNWKRVIVWAYLPNIQNRKSPFCTHCSCSPVKLLCSILIRMMPLMSIPHPTCRLFILLNVKGEQMNKYLFVFFLLSFLFIWKRLVLIKKKKKEGLFFFFFFFRNYQ